MPELTAQEQKIAEMRATIARTNESIRNIEEAMARYGISVPTMAEDTLTENGIKALFGSMGPKPTPGQKGAYGIWGIVYALKQVFEGMLAAMESGVSLKDQLLPNKDAIKSLPMEQKAALKTLQAQYAGYVACINASNDKLSEAVDGSSVDDLLSEIAYLVYDFATKSQGVQALIDTVDVMVPVMLPELNVAVRLVVSGVFKKLGAADGLGFALTRITEKAFIVLDKYNKDKGPCKQAQTRLDAALRRVSELEADLDNCRSEKRLASIEQSLNAVLTGFTGPKDFYEKTVSNDATTVTVTPVLAEVSDRVAAALAKIPAKRAALQEAAAAATRKSMRKSLKGEDLTTLQGAISAFDTRYAANETRVAALQAQLAAQTVETALAAQRATLNEQKNEAQTKLAQITDGQKGNATRLADKAILELTISRLDDKKASTDKKAKKSKSKDTSAVISFSELESDASKHHSKRTADIFFKAMQFDEELTAQWKEMQNEKKVSSSRLGNKDKKKQAKEKLAQFKQQLLTRARERFAAVSAEIDAFNTLSAEQATHEATLQRCNTELAALDAQATTNADAARELAQLQQHQQENRAQKTVAEGKVTALTTLAASANASELVDADDSSEDERDVKRDLETKRNQIVAACLADLDTYVTERAQTYKIRDTAATVISFCGAFFTPEKKLRETFIDERLKTALETFKTDGNPTALLLVMVHARQTFRSRIKNPMANENRKESHVEKYEKTFAKVLDNLDAALNTYKTENNISFEILPVRARTLSM